jgi:hypothetical protein
MQLASVLDFLQMNFLEVQEPNLIRALIKWGQAQVSQDGKDPNDPIDGQTLRSKILPCLKFINFHVLSNRDFALLSLEELGKVLSGDEKHAVMLCITLGDWSLMPDEIAPIKQPPRLKSTCIVKPRYQHQHPGQNIGVIEFYSQELVFELDRSAKLIGIELYIPQNAANIENAYKNFTMSLMNVGTNDLVGSGSSKEKFAYQGKQYRKVTSAGPLAAGVAHKLSIKFAPFSHGGIPYILESPSSNSCNDHGQLTVSLLNKDSYNWCGAKITELVFELF